MTTIAQLNSVQQSQIIAETVLYIQLAGVLLKRSFAEIPVKFDLRGRAAGMYRITRYGRCIRYNPYIFARYFDENYSTTIPHEVAHYINDCVRGVRRIRPHGPEWRTLMQTFGADASVTACFDLEGLPARHYQRYPYYCACNTHQLTSRRHNRIIRDRVRYHCRRCGAVLQAAKD